MLVEGLRPHISKEKFSGLQSFVHLQHNTSLEWLQAKLLCVSNTLLSNWCTQLY